jgi:hypothetical protein
MRTKGDLLELFGLDPLFVEFESAANGLHEIGVASDDLRLRTREGNR